MIDGRREKEPRRRGPGDALAGAGEPGWTEDAQEAMVDHGLGDRRTEKRGVAGGGWMGAGLR